MNINYDSPFNFKPIPSITPASSYWENGTWKFNMPEISAGATYQPSWIDIILHGITALTLVNAKADSLEYLKLFGDTEQLPETYLDTVTLSGGCEQNGTPTPTTPIDIVCNNGVIKYGAIGKNLFDAQNVEIAANTAISTDGSLVPNQGVNTCVSYIKVSPNTTYTISGDKLGDPSGEGGSVFYFRLATYNANKQFLGRSTDSETVSNKYTFTTGANVEYIRFHYAKTGNINSYQLELGSTATPYEPYQAGIYTDGTVETVTDSNGLTASAERLLAVGDYKDTQEVLSGSVTRNIGILVLDGTENWVYRVAGLYSVVISDMFVEDSSVTTNRQTPYCTHFERSTSWISVASEREGKCLAFTIDGTNQLGLGYPNASLPDISAFKQFLATQYANGTPVIIVYPLATATTELVSGQFLSKSPVTQTAGSISNLPIAITESQKTTPTPQQPLDINCNNGVVKVSPNLFDVDNNLLEGYYIESGTGILRQSSDGSSSCFKDFLPSKPNVTYTMSRIPATGSTALRMWAYDEDKNPISLVFNQVATFRVTGTTPAGTAYIRCSFGSIPQYSKNLQLELGSTLTTYMPYGQIYTDGTTETVEITGKNLWNPDGTNYGWIQTNGSLDTTSSAASRRIEVEYGKTYTYKSYSESNTFYNCIALYDENMNYISNSRTIITTGSTKTNTKTITNSNAKYMVCAYYIATTIFAPDWNMVVEGDGDISYEPYFNGGSLECPMLLSVGS